MTKEKKKKLIVVAAAIVVAVAILNIPAVSDSSHIALTHKGINISNKIMALFV